MFQASAIEEDASLTRTLIIVRTHRADAASLQAYDLYARAPGADVIFCVDERAGPVDMQGRAAIGYDEARLAQLGLYAHPNAGWRCGDYCYHVVRAARPGYDLYWLIEPDVRINVPDPPGFFARYAGHPADLLAARFGVRDEVWHWTHMIVPTGLAPQGCIYPITRLSGRAIDRLYAARRALSADPAFATPDRWPNDESFTASVLVAGGLRCLDLNDAGPQCYTRRTLGVGVTWDEATIPAAPRDGLIYHSVRPFAPLLDRAEARVAGFSLARSEASRPLRSHGDAIYFTSTAETLLRHPDHAQAALVPLLLSEALWRTQPWTAGGLAGPAGARRPESDARALAAAQVKLARAFGQRPGRNPAGTAHLARLRAPALLGPVPDPTDFELGAPFPLGRFPTDVVLPYAYDLAAGRLLCTLHVAPWHALAAPALRRAQGVAAAAAAWLDLAGAVRVAPYAAGAAEPVFVFVLGQPDLAQLDAALRRAGACVVAAPGVLDQLAALASAAERPPPRHLAGMLRLAVTQFGRVRLAGGLGGGCVIRLSAEAAGLVAALGAVFRRATWLFVVSPRRSWDCAAVEAAPMQAVRELLAGLQALRRLTRAGGNLHVVSFEALLADPVAALHGPAAPSAVTGVAGGPAAEDGPAGARLGGDAPAAAAAQDRRAPAEVVGNGPDAGTAASPTARRSPEQAAAWRAKFERLWSAQLPLAVLQELALDV